MGAGQVIAAIVAGVVVYFIVQALLTAYKIKDVLLLFGLGGIPFFFGVVAFLLVLLLLGSKD